jgi:hypothetical protein
LIYSSIYVLVSTTVDWALFYALNQLVMASKLRNKDNEAEHVAHMPHDLSFGPLMKALQTSEYMGKEMTLNDGTVVTHYKLAGMTFSIDY